MPRAWPRTPLSDWRRYRCSPSSLSHHDYRFLCFDKPKRKYHSPGNTIRQFNVDLLCAACAMPACLKSLTRQTRHLVSQHHSRPFTKPYWPPACRKRARRARVRPSSVCLSRGPRVNSLKAEWDRPLTPPRTANRPRIHASIRSFGVACHASHHGISPVRYNVIRSRGQSVSDRPPKPDCRWWHWLHQVQCFVSWQAPSYRDP